MEALERIAVALERIVVLLEKHAEPERFPGQLPEDGGNETPPEVCAGCGASRVERALHWKVRGAWVCITCFNAERQKGK